MKLKAVKNDRKSKKKIKEDFNNYLKKIRRGDKTKEQEKTLSNINMLFNGRNDAIKFIEGYSSMILEAKKYCRRTNMHK